MKQQLAARRPRPDGAGSLSGRPVRRGQRRLAADPGGVNETFSGELVLFDLAGPGADVAAACTIVVRFLAVQYFTNVLRGDWPAHLLRLQRSAALNALGSGLLLDRELSALRGALQAGTEDWPRPALALLLASAAAARAKDHQAGALALYRVACEAAAARGWWPEAAAAALEIPGFGTLAGDGPCRARWRRRAAVLAARARREGGQA